MKTELKHVLGVASFVLAVASFSTVSLAMGGGETPNTPADIIHPNIHTKVGNGDGTNANPNGVNANGGNIHGIANNPGQLGINPGDDGTAGFANQLGTVHGGIDAVNPNTD